MCRKWTTGSSPNRRKRRKLESRKSNELALSNKLLNEAHKQSESADAGQRGRACKVDRLRLTELVYKPQWLASWPSSGRGTVASVRGDFDLTHSTISTGLPIAKIELSVSTPRLMVIQASPLEFSCQRAVPGGSIAEGPCAL